MELESLGHFLRGLRERAGLSQEAVSFKASLSETYYGKIEIGKRRPDAATLMQILAVLPCQATEHRTAIQLWATARLPPAMLESLAHVDPQSGAVTALAVPLPKRAPRVRAPRRKLAAWLFVVASGMAAGAPLRVDAARPITDAETKDSVAFRRRLAA